LKVGEKFKMVVKNQNGVGIFFFTEIQLKRHVAALLEKKLCKSVDNKLFYLKKPIWDFEV
jgi:hypothetical protein